MILVFIHSFASSFTYSFIHSLNRFVFSSFIQSVSQSVSHSLLFLSVLSFCFFVYLSVCLPVCQVYLGFYFVYPYTSGPSLSEVSTISINSYFHSIFSSFRHSFSQSVRRSIFLSFSLFYLFVCLFVCLSVCLSVRFISVFILSTHILQDPHSQR